MADPRTASSLSKSGLVVNRRSSETPYRVPRVTTNSDIEEIEPSSIQVETNSKIRQVRWTDAMDACMIDALIHQLSAGPRRSDNGFTTVQVSKAIKSVNKGCGVVVSDKNVRSRLKTMKKEYVEVRQLLSMSGFGLDSITARITADDIAWNELLKGTPEFYKWRTKSCPRYDEFEVIFGNDSANGDRSVTGNDDITPPIVSNDILNEFEVEVEGDDEANPNQNSLEKNNDNSESNVNRRGAAKRKRNRKDLEEHSMLALSSLAESSKIIAKAFEAGKVNWQYVLEKLKGMKLGMSDIKQVMKLFRNGNSLADFFLRLNDEEYMHDWILEELSNIPPPHV